MKKIFLGILLGLVLGAGATWWMLHSGASAPDGTAAKPDAPKDATPAPEPGTVHLETDDQEKANLETAKPTPMEYKPETKGFARVLDPAPLAALLAEINNDNTSLNASTKEFTRLQTLKAGDNTSARALEAAEAATQRDQTALDAAKARLLSDWGKTLAERADLPQLVHTLLNQDAALIRVDILGGETLPPEPRELQVTPALAGGAPITAELLGPAPSADPQAQGAAFIALIAQHPPPPGTQLVAWLLSNGEGEKGFRLPRTAIVRYEGDTFVYAQTTGEDFERWRVKLGPPLRGNDVFVLSGVSDHDNIVVTAAQQLLSEELKAATGAPD